MKLFKTLLLLLATAFISVSVFAQHTYTLSFDDVFLMKRPSHCNKLRVLDMRAKKDDLGHLWTGAFNRYASIITEKPLDEFLSSYFKRMLKETSKGEDELLLVLYNLEIQDRPNGDELGTFYFFGDFYRGANDSYTFMGKVDSIFEVRSGWDVSKKVVEAGQIKLSEYFSNFAATAKADDAMVYSESQLTERRAKEKHPFPIYGGEFKKGIYYTVEQFINNQPSDTPFIARTYEPSSGANGTVFYFTKPNGKKGERLKEKNYFAIYDGTKWYTPGSNYALKMKFEGGEFYAYRQFRGIPNQANAMMAGAMFGLVGVLVATAAEGKSARYGVYESRFDPVKKDFSPVRRVY